MPQLSSPTPDATTTTNGKIRLTGDLSGTAASPQLASGGVVNTVSTVSEALATGTNQIPLDDTIPQITEGTEFLTCTITPKSATNRLVIDVNLACAFSTGAHKIAALFQNSVSDAIAAGDEFQSTGGGLNTVKVRHSMTAGTTSAITFRVRAGANVAGTMTVNGESGSRRFGGITKSSIVIQEVRA